MSFGNTLNAPVSKIHSELMGNNILPSQNMCSAMLKPSALMVLLVGSDPTVYLSMGLREEWVIPIDLFFFVMDVGGKNFFLK